MIDVTNGNLRVQSDDDNSALITVLDAEGQVTIIIFESELPWLISALGEVLRERQHEQQITESTRLLAAMMTG